MSTTTMAGRFGCANRYPAQPTESDLETLNLSGEEVWLNTKKVKLRRRLPRFKQRVRPSALKRKKENRPGEGPST